MNDGDRDGARPQTSRDGGPEATPDQPDGGKAGHPGLMSPSDKPIAEEAPDGEVAGTLDSRG